VLHLLSVLARPCVHSPQTLRGRVGCGATQAGRNTETASASQAQHRACVRQLQRSVPVGARDARTRSDASAEGARPRLGHPEPGQPPALSRRGLVGGTDLTGGLSSPIATCESRSGTSFRLARGDLSLTGRRSSRASHVSQATRMPHVSAVVLGRTSHAPRIAHAVPNLMDLAGWTRRARQAHVTVGHAGHGSRPKRTHARRLSRPTQGVAAADTCCDQAWRQERRVQRSA